VPMRVPADAVTISGPKTASAAALTQSGVKDLHTDHATKLPGNAGT